MKQLRVAGFVRDMGAGNVISPILLEMGERGHLTTLYIEKGGKAEGRVKHSATSLSTADEVIEAFNLRRFDVAVVGLSWPNRNLETIFEQIARSFGVPVVHAEDSLKAFDRSPNEADLILSIDESAAALARSACKRAEVKVVGFAGAAPMTPRQESVWAFNCIRQETGAKILYTNDADPMDSVATLTLLCECILRTKTPVRLMFAPHPKFASACGKDGRTQTQVLEEVLEPLRERNLLVPCPPGADGDEAAMLADATCSAYSTLLGRAAGSGKHAITLRTPESVAAFKAATTGRTPGLDKTWLMLMDKGFPVVKVPMPLDAVLAMRPPQWDVQPLSVELAADAIERFVQ